jgi:HlyD family type I secretion membrane fusion protein
MSKSGQAADQLKKMATPRRYVVAGYLVVLFTFGLLGAWATYAIIASAVVAPGVVALESDRKVVQHLEGGIVREILVREAEVVEEGDPLLILDDVEVRSNIAVLQQRKAAAEAVIARLEAEQSFAEELVFPEELATSSDPQIQDVLETQRNIFSDRRSIFLSQTEILEFRVEQLNGQAEGSEKQRAALERRLTLRRELFERLKKGEANGVIESNRLSELEDSVIQIEASVGEVMSEIAQVKAAAGEARLNVLKLRQEFSERANTELKDERAQLSEINERLYVATDRMERTSVVAPTGGKVQSLRVTTKGAVVRPGEILMEIVPLDDNLLIDARISPVDVDNVHPGLETEIRFSAFKSKLATIVLGEVQSISNDVVTPEDSNAPPYYLARIHVDEDKLPEDFRGKLTAGMPADVVVLTGERSVLHYLISPLTDAISKSLREE